MQDDLPRMLAGGRRVGNVSLAIRGARLWQRVRDSLRVNEASMRIVPCEASERG